MGRITLGKRDKQSLNIPFVVSLGHIYIYEVYETADLRFTWFLPQPIWDCHRGRVPNDSCRCCGDTTRFCVQVFGGKTVVSHSALKEQWRCLCLLQYQPISLSLSALATKKKQERYFLNRPTKPEEEGSSLYFLCVIALCAPPAVRPPSRAAAVIFFSPLTGGPALHRIGCKVKRRRARARSSVRRMPDEVAHSRERWIDFDRFFSSSYTSASAYSI